jgi:lipopolysaccharide biosynthesis regulator YciM
MANAKIGRNDPCHCGSGEKYKHCCLDKDALALRGTREWEAELNEAAAESLEPDAEKVRQSPERIRQLLSREGLTDSQKCLARFNLALALFHGGDFVGALAELDAIPNEADRSFLNQINLYRASCYAGLGKPEDALKIAEDVWSHMRSVAG